MAVQSARGGEAGETKALHIELLDEEIHDANDAVFTDPVVRPFREKHRRATINALARVEYQKKPESPLRISW